MPDQPFPLLSETVASIREQQFFIFGLRCELQEVIATSHDAIWQSLRLIAEADGALTRHVIR